MDEFVSSLGVLLLLFSVLYMMTGRMLGQKITIATLPKWLLRKGLRGVGSSARGLSKTFSRLAHRLWHFRHPNQGLQVAAWIIASVPGLAAICLAAIASIVPSGKK